MFFPLKMPDKKENIDQIIERRLKLYLETEGFDDVSRGVKELKKQIDDLRKSGQDLNKGFGGLEGAIQQLSTQYVKTAKEASKYRKDEIKDINILKKGQKELLDIQNGLFASMAKFAGVATLGAITGELSNAITQTNRYNKEIVKLSAVTTRFGVGITELENKIVNLSTSASLTRQETMSLMGAFTKSYKFPSMDRFGTLLKNLQGMVGSNAEAIAEYQSSIISLSKTFPGLAEDIIKLGKSGSGVDKQQIESRIKLLYLTHQLGDEEYRTLMEVVKANKQATAEDDKSLRKRKEQIAAMQQFKIQAYEVALGLGKTLLPVVEQISKFLKRLTNDGKEWYKAVLLGTAAFAAYRGISGKGISGQFLGGGSKLLAGSSPMANMADSFMGRGSPQKPLYVIVMGSIGGTGAAMASVPAGMGWGTAESMGGGGKTVATGIKGFITSGPGKALIISTMLMASSYGLGKTQNLLEAQGKPNAAGAAGLGSSLAIIGSYAFMGKMFGPWGMAIGAAVGGVLEFKNVIKSVNDIFHGSQIAANSKKWLTEQDKKVSDEEAKAVAEEKKNKDAYEEGKNRANDPEFRKQIQRDRVVAQQKMDEKKEGLRRAQDSLMQEAHTNVKQKEFGDKWGASRVIGGFFSGKLEERLQKGQAGEGLSGINKYEGLDIERQKTIKQIERREKQAQSKSVSQEDKSAAEKDIIILNKRLVLLDQIEEEVASLAKTEKDSYEVSVSNFKNIDSKGTASIEQDKFRVDVAEKQKELISSGLSLYDAQIDKQRMSGKIDMDSLKKTEHALLENVSARQANLNQIKETGIATLQASVDFGKLKDITKLTGKESAITMLEMINNSKEYQETRAKEPEKFQESITSLTFLAGIEAQLLASERERMDIISRRVAVLDTEVAISELLADGAGLMVQLADNYAIGVNASKEQRMKEYDAIQKTIGLQKEQIGIWREELASGVGEERKKEITQKILTLQNTITGELLKQQSITKTLRDGWVDAISAMNTGAGTFTKIIMDQNTNTAQALRLGAVVSNRSGSVIPGAGYRRSERFTEQQGKAGASIVSGRSSIDREFPFPTAVGNDSMRGMSNQGRGKQLEEYNKRGREAMDNKGKMYGVSGNPSIYLPAAVQASGSKATEVHMTHTVIVRGELSTENVAKKIAVPIAEMVAVASHNWSQAFNNVMSQSFDQLGKNL